MKLTKRMQQYRKERGITQVEMAKACGLSPNFVSAMERGVYQASAATLIAWANKCNVSIDELVGNTDKGKIIPELKTTLEELPEETQRKIYEMIKIALQ